MAKLRAASQQQQNQTAGRGTSDKRLPAAPDAKKKDKSRKSQSKTPERPSFFQNVHGDAAPLLPPHPQMYSEEAWPPSNTRPPPHPNYRKDAPRPKPATRQTYRKEQQAITPPQPSPRLHYKEPTPPRPVPNLYYKEPVHNSRKETAEKTVIFREKCVVHGQSKPFQCSVPKSMSCPSSRQTNDVERLKNWRRNSLTLTPSIISYSSTSRSYTSATTTVTAIGRERRSRPLSQGHELPPIPPGRMVSKQSHSSSRALSPPSTITSPSTSQSKNVNQTDDPQGRRSQFRRAWSLFSMGCHESHKKAPQQSILRQPTRHMYRRGISGLPIECTNRDLGVVF